MTNERAKTLLTLSEAKLRVLSHAIDRLMKWALKTHSSFKESSCTLLMWLRSCNADAPNHHPFRRPQEPTTIKRYGHRWKEFIFYVVRTFSLDEATRAREYGVQFTEDQALIIEQLCEILDEFEEAEMDHRQICWQEEDGDEEDSDEDLDPDDLDEDDNEGQEDDDEDDLDIESDADDDESMDENYSLLLTRVAEKLMQLSITFITQHFPGGDDLHSPLTHFSDVMGISNKSGTFHEPYNYTSYVAALIWVCRLLVLEYALPTRAYTTLGWPAGDTYLNKAERIRWLHRNHLTMGCFSPMARLIRVLAYGKQRAKAVGRPGVMDWDPDGQGFRIKEIRLRLNAFQQFVSDGIKLTEKTLQEKLLFGMDVPTIDLKSICDIAGVEKPLYCFIQGSLDKLPDGRAARAFMLNLMRSADSSKHLIDDNGCWDRIKVIEYLKAKKTFLKQLMKGATPICSGWLILDIYLTGGQPFRGRELGSTKFRNTESSLRNFFITDGEAFITTEYHKARASTNYSFYVIRYLPESVATLVMLYVVYIRPFAKMLFNNILFPQQEDSAKGKTRASHRVKKTSIKKADTAPQKMEKRVGRPRSNKRAKKPVEVSDPGYIFCSDETPSKYWTGADLSEILQKESYARLGVRINLWAWRHIIIGITKEHLEEVAPFFERNEVACKERLETNVYYSIFPWQAGHQRNVSVSIYGLDAAFPGRLQKSLRHFYRQISRLWHYWLGLLKVQPGLEWPILVGEKRHVETQTTPKKRRHESIDASEGHPTPESVTKRRRLIDSEIQTTPKKESTWLDVQPDDSHHTKRLIENTCESLNQIRAVVEKRRRSRGF